MYFCHLVRDGPPSIVFIMYVSLPTRTRISKQFFFAFFSLILASCLTGCGVSGAAPASTSPTTSPNQVSLTVSPSSANLQTGASQQFTATVTGTSNTAVTWKATGGSINASGLYTAPQSPGTYTVTATSVTDTSKSARPR